MWPTLFPIILFYPALTSSVRVNFPVGACLVCTTNYLINPCLKFLLCSLPNRLWCVGSINKKVLYELHWLFKFQSRSSHKSRNNWHESLSEEKVDREEDGKKLSKFLTSSFDQKSGHSSSFAKTGLDFTDFDLGAIFCLRPSAKDQGIT